jgi:SpoVK/Ycf46/Vps4 family AAA+-type ATPase
LLHGPAGSGKTCLVQQIIADIVTADGLVFQCNNHPAIFNDGLSQFRKVEPNRPIVCLFEDIDAIVDEHGEDEILTLLDGENQIDKVLNIATTNYPEKLDKRLVARPRRFDRVLKIGMPTAAVRKMYFEKKLKVSDDEIEKWVSASDGFSFAACAELVISVCCFEKKFEDAVETLKEMMSATLNSRSYNFENNPLGFAQPQVGK